MTRAAQLLIRFSDGNGEWQLVELPRGGKTIKARWIFDIKTDGKGVTSRYQTRLVAKGFSKINVIDFHEVFSPVSQFGTIRLLISIAVNL